MYMLNSLDYLYALTFRKVVKNRIPTKTCYGTVIRTATEGNELIRNYLLGEKPCAIGRIGTVEMGALNAYIAIKLGMQKHLPEESAKALYNNAGLFPDTEDIMFRWGEYYLGLGKSIDVFASFGKHAEDYFIKQYTDADSVVQLRALEPYYHKNPWSIALEGKRVLVVHPFEKSIREQYSKRKELFENPNVLPEFDLITLKAVQTRSDSTEGFGSWFEALDYMKEKMSAIDYDVALIGCGAYALPLAIHAKNMGKKAVVTAGATQILFGISGKRWDSHPFISSLYNPYWKRPDASETPRTAETFAGGGYW